MGYCTDCYIFQKCAWFCKKYDVETEEPKEQCFDKETVNKEGQ